MGPSLSCPWPRCRDNHTSSLVLWVIMAAARAPWIPPAATAWCFPRWEGTRLGTGCGIEPLEEWWPGCRDRGLGAGKPGCSDSLGLSGEAMKFVIKCVISMWCVKCYVDDITSEYICLHGIFEWRFLTFPSVIDQNINIRTTSFWLKYRWILMKHLSWQIYQMFNYLKCWYF